MSEAMINLLVTALGDTLLMVFASALFGCLLGLPLGVALHVTKAGQILANPVLNKLLGILVNIGRSVPFIILLVAMVGAIVLTHRQRTGVRGQNIADQIARRPEDAVVNMQPEVGQGVKL